MDNNISFTISMLADMNAKYLKPLPERDLSISKHWIHVSRDSVGKYEAIVDVDQSNGENARRAAVVQLYLNNAVLPNIDTQAGSIKGYYPINYYDEPFDLKNVLCFSKRRYQEVPLLPDIYQILNYNGRHKDQDDTRTWESKKNKMIFAGTDTGDRNPKNNARINACIWSDQNRDISEFHITNVVQIEPQKVVDYVISQKASRNVFRQPMTIEDQLEYKYIYSIDGNTASWDRPIWIMRSNSLLIKHPSDEVCWYYDIMYPGYHYIEAAPDNLKHVHEWLQGSEQLAQNIIANAQRFAKQYCYNPSAHIKYTCRLFETAAETHGA